MCHQRQKGQLHFFSLLIPFIDILFYLNSFSQHSSDAIDVDHEADYKEMVKKIEGSNPAITKIFVDMKAVQKLPSSGNLEDEENEMTDGDAGKVCTCSLCCSNISLMKSTESITQSC